MPATPTIRAARILVAAALTGALLASAGTAADAARARRLPPNTTGVQSGSEANGSGNLKTSLAVLPDGRIQVSWVPWTKTRNIKKWVVRVGPDRKLDVKVNSYALKPGKRSVVVPAAFGVTPSSGSFSFVKVIMTLKNAHTSGSPTKWIKAPIGATCTASAANRVTVGTFNVREWSLDETPATVGKVGWLLRGPRVVSEILSSGARVVALQEASGKASPKFGNVRQWTWILDQLNALDQTPGHHWVDPLDPHNDPATSPYYQGRASDYGLVGTRIVYDESKYTALQSGLVRLPSPSLLPWARLQATDGTQAAFTFAGTHLRVGDDAAAFALRDKQATAMINVLQTMHQARPDEQVILAGDMNSTANTRPYNNVPYKLLGAGFYDSFATASTANAKYGTTNSYQFPIRATPYRRDYIMALGPVRGSCSYVNRAYNSITRAASDHFMQVATLPLSTS